MIAKVIAFGGDRQEALARLARALAQMVVIVSGGTTNKSFLLELLENPEVRRGDVDTSWLDRLTAASQGALAPRRCRPRRRRPRRRRSAAGHRSQPVPRLGQPRSTAARRRTRSGGRAASRVNRLPPRRPPHGAALVRGHPRGELARRRPPAAGSSPKQADDRRTTILRGVGDRRRHPPRRGGRRRPPKFSRDDAGILRAPATALVVESTCSPATS